MKLQRSSSLVFTVVYLVQLQMPLVEQELLNPPWHPSSLMFFIGVRVAQSLVFCVEICSPFYCLSFCDLRLLITVLVSSNFS